MAHEQQMTSEIRSRIDYLIKNDNSILRFEQTCKFMKNPISLAGFNTI